MRDPTSVRYEWLLNLCPSVNPPTDDAYLELSGFERQVANETNSTALFDGNGGDVLFGAFSKRESATDYVRRKGFGLDLLRVAMVLAPQINRSIWSVLADAFKFGVLRRQWDFVSTTLLKYRKLATASAVESVLQRGGFLHPWFQSMHEYLPGVVPLVYCLSIPRQYYDPLSRPENPDPELVSPLYAQPLVELCFRIPSYLHSMEGSDRGLARRAFVSELPEEIRHREWKDRGAGAFETRLRSNLKFARELLFDGDLVRNKLVDENALRDALSDVPTKAAGFVGEAFACVNIEAWLQFWKHASAEQIAA